MPSLSLAYITCRRDCKIEWWLNSITNQSKELGISIPPIIVVDFYAAERDSTQGIWKRVGILAKHVPFMPNPWSGEHRLTKQNWWSASAARNTALVACETEWLAYCDDLSCPMPGWLSNAVASTNLPGVTLGAYRKVKEMVVQNGAVTSFKEYAGGFDSRWNMGATTGAVPVSGEYLFGCSLVAPIESLLRVGGWPAAMCDGMSFEDVIMGIVLSNIGVRFWFNRNLLTFESEEHHHIEPPFKRSDYGVSPNDKSHAVLNIAKSGCKFFDNCYEGGMRAYREKVLKTGVWDVIQNPRHEFYTKTPLEEL